ncbi:MAG: adenylate/guanylate cyclase domain-containing protein [Inquilinus limosus]|uniref:Adenylate/guanylate cyclase domain-containing protein n=1 Tax=Inquilinus limosus TaxID=171674 RepID=A0A952FPZ4_9PROT|nr:adenylate/guanylate cyclase domain-containing protein [Inquilinus limosus]
MTAEGLPAGTIAAFAALRRWLGNQALLAGTVQDVAEGFADRLLASGIPLWRAYLSATTLHPDMEAFGLTWTRDGGRESEMYGHGSWGKLSSPSPIYAAVLAAREAAIDPAAARADDLVPLTRYRLERGEGPDQFPILAEFRDAGATDYLCFIIPFGFDGTLHPLRTGATVTLATDRPGGFTAAEVQALDDLMPVFGAAVRIGIDLAAMRTVLSTYLGRDVGRRVLQGEIRRGSVETISAAILVGDLRGFTALADALPQDQLVSMLDDYLDALATPVEAHGGQVLKFMGDGLLATFAFAEDDPAETCGRALAAAAEALDRIAAINLCRAEQGVPVMTLDVALHAGDVLYGNVGSGQRLDFTIIGPAVNEAARLENLCGVLGVPMVVSRRFVEALAAPERFRCLGPQTLRGVRVPVEVFTPA